MWPPFALMPGRLVARELMDDSIDSVEELRENLVDIERANRWLGGLSSILQVISRYNPTTIVDVGCGSGDVSLALIADAARRGRALKITGIDVSPQMVTLARERAHGKPGLTFMQARAEMLPFETDAFDLALCNLSLHHFDPDAAVEMLREMRRVSRRTPLVADLRRSFAGFAGAWIFSRLFTRNRLTRYDAPLSVRRAYTPAEASKLAKQAGWSNPAVRATPFFRMVMIDA